jgi:TatD DNase family protein
VLTIGFYATFAVMYLIDTHTHMFASQFDDDRAAAVQRAIDKGVEKLLLPNINSESIGSMLQLCSDFPHNCFPMMGLHPCDVKENYQEELAIVAEQLEKNAFVAVGEIGIDLYWDKSSLPWQREAFSQQIELAKQHQLPIAIHVRDSFDEVFEVVESHQGKDLTGVFHCFTGNLEQAKRAIDLGFMLGVGGVATFKNSGVDKTLSALSLQHLVLETDSPYLAPTPHRGKRNESSYLPLIAEKLADIYGCSLEEVAQQTSQNAETLFGL